MSPQEEKTEEAEPQIKELQDDDPAVEDVELADTDEEGSGDKAEDNNDDKRIRMKVAVDAPWKDRMWEVFTTFWPLGFIAFGGPQAHVAILRDHLVIQRDWLDEEQFTELFAIGQVSDLLLLLPLFQKGAHKRLTISSFPHYDNERVCQVRRVRSW